MVNIVFFFFKPGFQRISYLPPLYLIEVLEICINQISEVVTRNISMRACGGNI